MQFNFTLELLKSTLNDLACDCAPLHIANNYSVVKQGRKRPLDTPKRKIERREREGESERKVEGLI